MPDRVDERPDLHSSGPQRTFSAGAREAAFLLGGIGTGNVSVGARGELRDWEIFNRPGKGVKLPNSFFAIWARPEGGEGLAKVIEARPRPPFTGSHGFAPGEAAGLPRLDDSSMRGEYPFVRVEFTDAELPVTVALEAFTPFIPLDPDNSGIPGAILRYIVTNPGVRPVDVTVAGSLPNAAGFAGFDAWGNPNLPGEGRNELRRDGPLTGLFYTNPATDPGDIRHGSMALVTAAPETTAKPTWLDGGWWDGIQDFWDDFRADGLLDPDPTYGAAEVPAQRQRLKTGSLGVRRRLAPGETAVCEFILAWHFPNRVRSWDEDACSCGGRCETVRNYYANRFGDAWEVASYLQQNLSALERSSRDFHRALFGSTLPPYVLDALAANITVLRSPTCFRLADGTFLGYEGCHDRKGCCEGSCTHVWNYAQTLAFLFPELERTMRRVEFGLETGEDGRMAFRTKQVFGESKWEMFPAADGQPGTIVRLYRDWKLSGDEDFLRALWPKAAKALDFSISYWDTDGDGVLDGEQHNTYDIEFHGPNSLTNSIFLAALKAGAEIAGRLGEEERASRYREVLARGSAKMDELLWNGEYYVQRVGDVNRHRYQYGEGCLSDQLLGQSLAHAAGLGYILPEEHVKRAISAVFRHNFRPSLRGHHHVQRVYALDDEAGLLLCTWPRGGRPRFPFVYSDEIWTGIEYQVAAHLIYEGFIDEGLTVVKAVRDRHDGYRRNPWDEAECGHHYARSLASWALLPALSGFHCDMAAGEMSFAPVLNADDFACFWSTGRAWGIYRQRKAPDTGALTWEIEALHGSLEGMRVNGVRVGAGSR